MTSPPLGRLPGPVQDRVHGIILGLKRRIDKDRDANFAMATLTRIEWLCEQLAAKDAEIERLWHRDSDAAVAKMAVLEAQLAAATRRLEEAEKVIKQQHDAIAEYYRYQTGGETRGSYDGKPERNGLWKAMYAARSWLTPAKGVG